MMRPIVLGNGELHVNLNASGQVEDLHFPYIGLSNHTAGSNVQHHIGVWVDGTISWLHLDASDWEVTATYPYRALISRTKAINTRLGVMLEFNDTVDSDKNAFLRNIHVVNMRNHPRQIRLFMHQAFKIDDVNTPADTAQMCHKEKALLHYRGDKAFVISGLTEGNTQFDQYSIGSFGLPGQEGTFRDAEDGELSMSSAETGQVDSTVRFLLHIPAQDSRHVQYWIAAGGTHAEAYAVHRFIKKQGVHPRIQHTLKWWHNWMKPATSIIDRVDEEYHDSFIRSLIFMKSCIDKRGAIVSTKTVAEPAATYCNPYEAASIIWPLVRLGYTTEPRRFFEFCSRSLLADNSLPHLLRPDGAPGPNIFAQNNRANAHETISIAGAALVVFMFAQFHQAHPKKGYLTEFYDTLIHPLARLLVASVDSSTSLPKPTHDIWNQHYLTSTHSAAVMYAALQAASELAEAHQDADSAVAWRLTAVDIHTAAKGLLQNSDQKMIYRGFTKKDGAIYHDATLDASSVFSSFMFGLFSTEGSEVHSSVERLVQQSNQAQTNPGIHSYYDASVASKSASVVASLWLAQYYTEKNEESQAKDILRFVLDSASSTDMLQDEVRPLPEDMHSSFSCWGHAELVSTILDMIASPKET